MKILMWGRYDLFALGGGDKIQIENTAMELRNLGIEVDISTSIKEDLSKYDLVHLFQLDWTPETYFYARKAKKANKPLVLSPIHHSVKEMKRFDDEYGFGLRKVISTFTKEQHTRDTWKNIYRSIFNPVKLIPTVCSVFMGLKNMHKKTLQMSDIVLVQTDLEAKDLKDTYGVDIKWEKVSNGVGRHFIESKEYKNPLGFEDYILCVGRIEARKNQINVIKAVEELIQEEDSDLNVVFVGAKNKNHKQYIKEFEKLVAGYSWVSYFGKVPYEEMPSLFHFAKVAVSASWLETSGLTSLEALFSGANIVASGDRAEEILGNTASYCDPGSISSIKDAISEQLQKDTPVVDEFMREEYTWESVARKTKKIYEGILNALT